MLITLSEVSENQCHCEGHIYELGCVCLDPVRGSSPE